MSKSLPDKLYRYYFYVIGRGMLNTGTIIILVLLVVFIATFIVPLLKRRYEEGFANRGSGGGYKSYMADYLDQRKNMITSGKNLYNNLGASLNPILPTFAVAPANIDNNPDLTVSQYLQQFDSLTTKANKNILQALGNPDMTPSDKSPTNMGPSPLGVKASLPPSNDLLIKARQCEIDIKNRESCSMLDNPKYKDCGICIDAGTRFNGERPNTFIGGLLSLITDRNDAIDQAAGEIPIHQPTLGKCPPGMFYVDSASCQKAVNQLNCTEIGNSGGFQGGKTKEGLEIPAVSCAQAPVANAYVYQPPDKTYNVNLRFMTPFGTGITKVVVTHLPTNRTFTADNNGNPGQEFTLSLRGVKEQDPVNIMVIQEQPHRPKGQAEVFYVYETDSQGEMRKYDQQGARDLCTRLATTLATKAQVQKSNMQGGQAPQCGITADGSQPMYSVQSGYQGFVGYGSHAGADFCPSQNPPNGAWCYGFKPVKSIMNNQPSINTKIYNFFESFQNRASPPQGASKYSQFTDPNSTNPPGTSERAILIQWEMEDSLNRNVSFQPTITHINTIPVTTIPNPLRLIGPFSNSAMIRGPAWTQNMSMQKNQFWLWGGNPSLQSVVFTARVPGYLQNPYYEDDITIAPMGPLITNPATMELLQTSPCFKDDQSPGSYSIACLRSLFEGAGGDPAKGKLATDNGGLSQLNSYGDLSAISGYLDELYGTATTGKDSDGNVISMDMNTRIAAMNSAAMLLFGFKITNPCEDIVDNPDGSIGLVAKPMSNVTPDCLQFLWLNNQTDADRSPMAAAAGTIFSATYTSIADRFSGLRYNESTPDRRNQYPFQACQLTGTMAPIKNGKPDDMVIGQLTNMDNLQAVQNFFNGIQKTANYGKNQKEQAIAMKQCYGINQVKANQLGAGCTLIPPAKVAPGITCYINLGDPTDKTNYVYQSKGTSFLGGGQNTPNTTFYLASPLNGQSGCISIQTTDPSPLYLRHSGFRIWAHSNDNSTLFANDASWKVVAALNNDSSMVSFQSTNYPDKYFSQSKAPNEIWNTTFAGSVDDANAKSFTVIGVPYVPMPPSISVAGPFSQVAVNGTTYYLITGNAVVTTSAQVNVNYFAVGGGGGAGSRNGGGAGGLQTNVPGIAAFPSQFTGMPLSLSPGIQYAVSIGAGGGGNRQQNGGNTTFTADSITPIVAIGGAYGGATGQYCSASNGGCGGGGGGCQSVGAQGGSTNGPSRSPITNAGAGIGGAPQDYWVGGPGIAYANGTYGAGSPDAKIAYTAPANSGNGGASGGAGGSGIFILSIASQ